MLLDTLSGDFYTEPDKRGRHTRNSATNMPAVKVGDHAPAFTATMQNGATIRLADYLGQRGVVLFFYPQDGTPICTQEACAYRDSYERFVDAGAEVIGISSDSAEGHQAFAEKHNLSFPLLSDGDGSLRQLFGVAKTWGLFPGRVTYVVEGEGITRLIYSAQLASDEHVRQALQVLENGV